MMPQAYRELLGKDPSTSETGHGSDEEMDWAQFRNVVGFLGRPTTIDRCVDAMGHNRSWTKQPINPSLSEEVVGQEHIGCESLQALD
jgi:hypothetical protein